MVFRDIVDIRQGHQQFVTAAGDDQQGRFLQHFRDTLGRRRTDLHMVHDLSGGLRVAMQFNIEHLADTTQSRVGEDRLVIEAADHLE